MGPQARNIHPVAGAQTVEASPEAIAEGKHRHWPDIAEPCLAVPSSSLRDLQGTWFDCDHADRYYVVQGFTCTTFRPAPQRPADAGHPASHDRRTTTLQVYGPDIFWGDSWAFVLRWHNQGFALEWARMCRLVPRISGEDFDGIDRPMPVPLASIMPRTVVQPCQPPSLMESPPLLLAR